MMHLDDDCFFGHAFFFSARLSFFGAFFFFRHDFFFGAPFVFSARLFFFGTPFFLARLFFLGTFFFLARLFFRHDFLFSARPGQVTADQYYCSGMEHMVIATVVPEKTVVVKRKLDEKN